MASQQGFKQLAQLYRSILRAHRDKLPGPLRMLGDSYASEEFRRHVKAKTTPAQWREFGKQWSAYVSMLEGSADLEHRSGDIPEQVLSALTAAQQEQLLKLQQAAVDLAKGASADGQPKLDSSPLG
eukprot:GHUV01001638.1.p1 GENE.GHUV01001638.1~~GHUV01001638.1.p1  ORF type:complete len:126 (+),score=26.27 GHUV01001638.1:271-648(+)